ncbi:MAG: penicillin-binding protein 2 [Gammaproteobacteria bacterium]|nr:penicillin-binding protein 2 [Gammaproteobacteria bacterium]
MAPDLSIKDRLSEHQAFVGRALVIFAVAVLLVVGLIVRLVQLQVWEHDVYRTRSDENRILVQPLAPQRGLIYDRNGVLLADNRPVFSLELVGERIDDLSAFIEELSTVVTISEEDVTGFYERLKRRRRPFEPIVLKLTLTEDEIAKLAVNRHRFINGMQVNAKLVRFYPYGELFTHAIGSVRRVTEDDLRRLDPVNYSATTFVGKLGVEQFYERSLHGEVGYQRVETDAHGRIRQELERSLPQAGQNLSLHLDSRLQIAASGALGERRGAIVAIDTRSGGILAMVSNPGYDPNLFVTGISNQKYQELVTSRDTPLFNRAINGQYAPGSTFKLIVALAGLTYDVVTWEEQIEDRGWFKLPNHERIYRDWSWTKDNSGGQGIVDLNRAIYRSSNVFFYNLATRLHIDQLTDFASQFGFGRVMSVDVAGASNGLLPDPIWKRGAKGEVWYPGDNVNMGIGQGDLLVTPLQLATVASVIANRGKWVRPQMLLASDLPLSEVDPPPSLPRVQGPSADDWEWLIDSMEDVVHRGNKGYRQNGVAWAYIGRGISYRMAGKSGTAQVVEIKQGEEYDEEELDEYNRKHAWFMAFAPADDPAIAVSVLVENGGGGSSVAGPIAREVLDAHLLPQLAGLDDNRARR